MYPPTLGSFWNQTSSLSDVPQISFRNIHKSIAEFERLAFDKLMLLYIMGTQNVFVIGLLTDTETSQHNVTDVYLYRHIGNRRFRDSECGANKMLRQIKVNPYTVNWCLMSHIARVIHQRWRQQTELNILFSNMRQTLELALFCSSKLTKGFILVITLRLEFKANVTCPIYRKKSSHQQCSI